MNKLNGRELKALFILSIVVPIGLLATFRLTGILLEPLTITETITADTVYWNMSRPTKYGILLEKIENLYADETISVNFTLIVGSYHENEPDFPSYGNDYIKLGIITTANASRGFIHLIKVRLAKTDVYEAFYIENHPDAIRLENLQMEKTRWASTSEYEAYVEALKLGQPNNCSLEIWCFWLLFDRNNVDHSATPMLEVVGFDGNNYRKVVMPIQLKVLVP